MSRIRFSMRRMMIALAILAALFELFVGRPARFRRIAEAHATERGRVYLTDLDIYLVTTRHQPEQGREPAYYKECDDYYEKVQGDFKPLLDFADHHNRLIAKYEDAAAHPWRLVSADPPAPPAPSQDVQLALWNSYRDYMGQPDRPTWPSNAR